jgi:hypothetical protein
VPHPRKNPVRRAAPEKKTMPRHLSLHPQSIAMSPGWARGLAPTIRS